jgi:hypothetical protein
MLMEFNSSTLKLIKEVFKIFFAYLNFLFEVSGLKIFIFYDNQNVHLNLKQFFNTQILILF